VNLGGTSSSPLVYSGRGRPRTKEIVDRPLPVGIVLGSPSPGSDIFKNRKIRVGGIYQAKVPKFFLEEGKQQQQEGKQQQQQQQQEQADQPTVHPRCRKPPQLVSTEYPHLTQGEVDQYETNLQQLQRKNRGPSTCTTYTSTSTPEGKKKWGFIHCFS
jgi:hypothetical protein